MICTMMMNLVYFSAVTHAISSIIQLYRSTSEANVMTHSHMFSFVISPSPNIHIRICFPPMTDLTVLLNSSCILDASLV